MHIAYICFVFRVHILLAVVARFFFYFWILLLLWFSLLFVFVYFHLEFCIFFQFLVWNVCILCRLPDRLYVWCFMCLWCCFQCVFICRFICRYLSLFGRECAMYFGQCLYACKQFGNFNRLTKWRKSYTLWEYFVNPSFSSRSMSCPYKRCIWQWTTQKLFAQIFICTHTWCYMRAYHQRFCVLHNNNYEHKCRNNHFHFGQTSVHQPILHTAVTVNYGKCEDCGK